MGRRAGVLTFTLLLLAGRLWAPDPGLTVFAAASLGAAFQDLGTIFERNYPGRRVRFNFAGSQQLAVQLEHGARADLFASADERWMAYVAERDLLAEAPRIFAHNRLVAILPRANPAGIAGLRELARPDLKLVIAAEAVPVGRYTRMSLSKLSRANGFPRDYQARVLANVVSEEETVKAVVAKVELGEADAGIVYASDATGPVASRLQVLAIPEPQNVVADYPMAVLRGASAPDAAKAFAALVLGPEGQRVLQAHGLIPAAVDAGMLAPANR
jgi:molybdate transport system substrate-binding protein